MICNDNAHEKQRIVLYKLIGPSVIIAEGLFFNQNWF